MTISCPTSVWAVCGDATVDLGEDCDDGDAEFEAGERCSADCLATRCGHATGSAGPLPTATDALFALRSVVGVDACNPCVCDTDASGDATATDVLRILAAAIGQEVSLACLACTPLVRQGSLTVLPVLPIPNEARARLLEERAGLEALGYVVADDGSTLGWPERPARGWLVRMGDRLAVTDADGDFTVSIDEGGQTVGSIAHPQQSDDPIFELRADQLGRLGDEAVEFEFELEFYGACGMNDDPAFPDPAPCAALVPQTFEAGTPASGAHHHHAHEAGPLPSGLGESARPGTSASSQTDPQEAKRIEGFGTYPLGNQSCCRQFDGHLGDGDTTTPEGVVINYWGSTCAQLVDSGCCAGELGSLKNSAFKAVGALEPVSCERNHKGRFCQEVSSGDLNGQVRGELVGQISNHDVTLGETVDVEIHNNGCFGETFVEKTQEEIFGILEGGKFSGGKITHFDGAAPLEMYMPDRSLTYTTPRCTKVETGNERDVYAFAADWKRNEIRFALNTENLWRFTADGSAFDGERNPPTPPTGECPEFHLRGTHPCNDAPDPGGPCGHGVVERVVICGDGVVSLGEDCEPSDDALCPGECENCDCPGTVCGNNIVEAGEECDGSATPPCEVCLLDCTCIQCGNDRIDPTEECDGTNLGGATCETQGFASGTLTCSENCFFDTIQCFDVACGNGQPEAGEECDDGNLENGDGCSDDCKIEVCGDGILDFGEQCDVDHFFCHGGSCLPGCECDNKCAADNECGADSCLNERCITPCGKRSDCGPGELCIVPATVDGDQLQAGCSPVFSGDAQVGERCESGEDCESFSCVTTTGECSEFCTLSAGGDAECPGGACLEILPGTNYGLCGTQCESESDCDSDQACQLVSDTSANQYGGACGLNFGAGELGDACSTATDCNSFLCFSPPETPGFCTTDEQCGADAFCTNFFVCAQPACTQFCENDDDCGGSHSVCKSIPFPTPSGTFDGSQKYCAVP